MTAYAWWEIGSVAAYALLLVGVWVWPDNGDDGYCDCRDCADAIGPLEVWLEQPVREACELSDDEEAVWQRIRAGA